MNRLLFELQEADILLAGLARELSRLDGGGSVRAERDELQKKVDAATAKLRAINTARTDKELQLKSTEEKIALQQNRMMNAKNAHEVTSLQRDIASLGHARGDLDEQILMLMDEAETAAAQLKELEGLLAEGKRAVLEIEGHCAAETARLDGDIAEAKNKRAAIAAQLDSASLAKYAALAKQHQGLAVAHREKGNCSGCGMALTPYNLREAKDAEWPICENCNRLLFLG